MHSSVKTDINARKILAKYDTTQKRATMWMKNEIAKDSSSFLPFKNGTLDKSVNKSIGDGTDYLIWDIIYAKFLYYGKVMIGVTSRSAWAKRHERKIVTDKNLTYRKLRSNSGPFWFERAKAGNKRKWIQGYGRVMKDRE